MLQMGHTPRPPTEVNGTLMQHGNTRNFLFDVHSLMSYLSPLLTLSPGDLIATSTPAGVGFSCQPPVVLQLGDTRRMAITGLGVLENPVKDAEPHLMGCSMLQHGG
jgi:2-keto-4-pentenoate hydratase/2-oxohepta-3-ene-1,7-dioic acid hydratase in catechol pathway